MKAHWTIAAASAVMLALPPAAFAQSGQQQGNAAQSQPSKGQDAYRRADTPGRPAVPNSDVEYDQAMQRLFQAAQRLREAVQAMAQRPPGEHRNEAMDEARKALLETQEAMSQYAAKDQAMRDSRSGSTGSTSSAVGGGSGGSGMSASGGKPGSTR